MSDYKIEMGKRLKEKRKSLGLTQEQLAEKLNISIKHYGGVERGIAGLSIENLIELSNILGVSLDYLLKGETLGNDVLPVSLKELYLTCPVSKRLFLIEALDSLSKLWI